MTRVLLVVGIVAGGVGRHVQQLVGGLCEQGHDVQVACPGVVATRFGLARAGARRVEAEIGARPVPHRDRRIIARLAEAMEGADVVHAHGLRAGALAALARDERAQRKPLVVTTHNAPPGGRLAGVVYRSLERIVCRSADLVLGVSGDLVERAETRGAAQVDRAVVPALRVEPGQSPAQVRAGLGMQDGQPLVVSAGRLSPQKGFDRLLEGPVVQALRRHDARLVIAGDGPQRAALQRRIDRLGAPVQLLGHRDDVPDLYGAADLAVSAARWEGQPVWLQEVLSVGAPIVAADVGGTADVVGEGALLVPGEDVRALAEAIDRVLAEPDLAAGLRIAALARAAELPTTADAVTAALTAYRRAATTRAERHVD